LNVKFGCQNVNKKKWNYLHGMNNVKTVIEKSILFRIWKNLVCKMPLCIQNVLKHVILTDYKISVPFTIK